MKKLITIAALVFAMDSSWADSGDRWYTQDDVQTGEQVFKQNCASCHGQNAEATPNWKQTDDNGNYPPPPLNGTAHAWHHDMDVLREQIREGGLKLGGVMPPFAGTLTEKQIDQAIAYFQSKWPDDLYAKWAKHFEVSSLPSLDGIANTDNPSITRYLKERLGDISIGTPSQTAIEGIWKVKLNDRYVYLIQNGEYAMIGDLIDLKNGKNLSRP